MQTQTLNPITPELISQAYTYADYHALIDKLMAEGKTTGTNHAPDMLEYTKLNMHRVRKWDDKLTLPAETAAALAAVKRPLIWLAITEWWCGDAAHNVPVMAFMAKQNPNITFRLILRDEHPEVMERYLTNGGKAIPILVCLDANTLAEVGRWGPRPAPVQQMVMDNKANPEPDYKKFTEKLHLWYAQDKGQSMMAEFVPLLQAWG